MTKEELERELQVHKDNEEMFATCMKEITRTLGLNEDTLWEEVETYAMFLKDYYIITNQVENIKQTIKRLEEENKRDYGVNE